MDKMRLIILSIGIVMIVGFSLYSFMGSNPSSPKAGTKIQPVKTITLPSPISDNSSPQIKSRYQFLAIVQSIMVLSRAR